MFYTANPELDAARHEDAMEAAQEASAREYEQISEEIRVTFTELVTSVPLMRLTAPQCHRGSNKKIKVPIIESIDDSLAYDGPHNALMEVIAQSQCPLVVKLRESLAQYWIETHAENLVGANHEAVH